MRDDALEIPVVANQGEFNRAMKEILQTSDLTADQIRKKFSEANPKADKMFENFAANQNRALDRMQQKLDPVVRQTRQLEMVQRELDLAVKTGAISQDRANQILELAQNKYRATGAAAKGAAAAQQSFLNVSSQGRFIIGNTTAQISDMVVQAEMGADAFRILGQQVPQIAGGFTTLAGPVGIIAGLLGTVAAIGFPLAGFLLNIGEESDEAAEKVKNFADAWQQAEQAIGSARAAIELAASDDVTKLTEIYNEATDEVRDLVRGLAEIQVADVVAKTNIALSKLGDGVSLGDAVKDQVGGVGAALLESTAESAEQLKREIEEIEQTLANASFAMPELQSSLKERREELALLQGDLANAGSLAEAFAGSDADVVKVRELIKAIEEGLSASNYQGAADGISQMLALLKQLGVEVDQGYAAELRRAEDLLRQAFALTEDLQEAAENVGRVDMSASAREMVKEIRSAHAALIDLKAEGQADLDVARLRNQFRDDPVKLAGELAGLEFDRKTAPLAGQLGPTDGTKLAKERAEIVALAEEAARLQQATRNANRASKAASRDGGLFASSERDIDALKLRIDLIGKSRAEVVEATTRQNLLNEARRRGIDLDARQAETGQTIRQQIDQKAEAIGKLTAEYEEANGQAQLWNQANEDLQQGLLDSIMNGESFTDTMADVAKAIARARLEAVLFGEEGIFTGFADNLFSGGWFKQGGASGGGGAGGGLLNGALIPGILHTGGVAGADGYGHGRSFSPSTWSGAQKYHTGGIAGLMPNEVPAILERGEVVLPNGTSFSGGGGNERPQLSVVIHNAPEGDHDVQMSSDGRTLEIMMQDQALKAVAGPKGQRMMKQTYGVRPGARGA